jgi:hypothetical protein
MPDAPLEAESQPEVISTDSAEISVPAEGEATVTVQNGRRRGRRRVMKKKKVKDDETDPIQLRKKKLFGSPSPKTNLNPRSSNLHLPGSQAARKRSLLRRRGREV